MKEKATTREEAIARLCDIVALLRKECPWDRVQTHESLKTCMIEEAYEVCDAIDRQDYDNLREELGDVMLQVIFHSALEEEKGTFDITDVINLLTKYWKNGKISSVVSMGACPIPMS